MQQDDPNYERPPLKLDFRASADWGYRDDFNTQVVYMKKWQAMMRKDMKDLFANEVEPNVYEVNQFFWENNEMRKGSDMMHEVTAERILDERFHPDFMPLLTRLIVYWSKVGDQARSEVKNLWGDDLNEEQRQHAYLGWYANKNIPRRMYNHGYIDDDQFIYYEGKSRLERQAALFYDKDDFEDSARKTDIRSKHIVLKRMLKWFSSDEGQNFIIACDRNIRIKQDRDRDTRLPQFSKTSPAQQWLSQRP